MRQSRQEVESMLMPMASLQPQLQLLEDGRARSSAGTSTSGSSSSSSTSPPQSTSLPPQKDPPGLCAPSHTPEDRCAPGHSTQQPQAEGSGGYLWWHSRPPLSKEEESEYVLSVKLLRDETMRRDLEAALARLTLKEQQVSDYFGNTRQAVEDRAVYMLRRFPLPDCMRR
eukprot:jgi/Mesen1/6856/ME000351S05968